MTTEGLSILPWPRTYSAHYVLADRPRRMTILSNSQYTVAKTTSVIELTVTVAVLQKILIDWCSTPLK